MDGVSIRLRYRAAREETRLALERSGVQTVARGGSYVFVDFAPVLRGRPLRALLEVAIDHGVLLAPGDGCGEAYATWGRICFTSVPPARLREGLARLDAAIRALAP